MMRTITTASGTEVELDGDVLAVIETVSRDLARRHTLDYGFEDVAREFQFLVEQLDEADLRTYLKESLFMSFNRFENDRMQAIVRKAIRVAGTDTPDP
jgi:phage gp29-like protein